MNPPDSPLPSPGVGQRRRGPKFLPRLPPSAFSPPNTGTSDRFPLPPSPSTIHPASVVDAHVTLDLAQWKEQTGQVYGGRITGLVAADTVADLESSNDPILSVMMPFKLEEPSPEKPPTSTKPVSLTTAYVKPASSAIDALRWALEHARVVDIDLQCDISQEDALWEDFVDVLTKATADLKVTPIVLSNVLPPPDDFSLPIVKLMNHPTYRTFQGHVAALSLFPNLNIKFLPPRWSTTVPATLSEQADEAELGETNEWKRRIKMYLGPILEAFGYERIIFGSSPAGSAPNAMHAGQWYEMARESLAELGVEQVAIDGVFGANAKAIYGEQ